MKKSFKVSCANCGKEQLVDGNQIRVVPVGYKGKVKCYTTCDYCKNEILLPINCSSKEKLNSIFFE